MTRTTAESLVIDSTATACTAALVLIFDCSICLMPLSAFINMPALNSPVVSSTKCCRSSLALPALIDIIATTALPAAVANSALRWRCCATLWWCHTTKPLVASEAQMTTSPAKAISAFRLG